MVLSNKAYDFLKNVVLVVLPGLASLYAGLAELWKLPNVTGVVASITLVTTFLGLILKVSTRKYNNTENAPDGDLFVSEVDGEKYLSLGANRSIDEISTKETVMLKVVHHSVPSE